LTVNSKSAKNHGNVIAISLQIKIRALRNLKRLNDGFECINETFVMLIDKANVAITAE